MRELDAGCGYFSELLAGGVDRQPKLLRVNRRVWTRMVESGDTTVCSLYKRARVGRGSSYPGPFWLLRGRW